jgi:hypothetical protein
MSDMNDDRKKLRQRNLALAGILLVMVIVFFAVSVVKLQEGMNVPG